MFRPDQTPTVVAQEPTPEFYAVTVPDANQTQITLARPTVEKTGLLLPGGMKEENLTAHYTFPLKIRLRDGRTIAGSIKTHMPPSGEISFSEPIFTGPLDADTDTAIQTAFGTNLRDAENSTVGHGIMDVLEEETKRVYAKAKAELAS